MNRTGTSGAVNVCVTEKPRTGVLWFSSWFVTGSECTLCIVESEFSTLTGCPARTPMTRGT